MELETWSGQGYFKMAGSDRFDLILIIGHCVIFENIKDGRCNHPLCVVVCNVPGLLPSRVDTTSTVAIRSKY